MNAFLNLCKVYIYIYLACFNIFSIFNILAHLTHFGPSTRVGGPKWVGLARFPALVI